MRGFLTLAFEKLKAAAQIFCTESYKRKICLVKVFIINADWRDKSAREYRGKAGVRKL
jgi:hypothetical protein